MKNKKRLYYALGGFFVGLLTASIFWLCVRPRQNADIPAGTQTDTPTNLPSPKITNPPDKDIPPTDNPAPEVTISPVENTSSADSPTPEVTISPDKDTNPDNDQSSAPTTVPTNLPSEKPTATPKATISPGENLTPTNAPTNFPSPKITTSPDKDTPPTDSSAQEVTVPPDKNTDPDSGQSSTPTTMPTNLPSEKPTVTKTPESTENSANLWEKTAVYTGGDIVNYQGCLYRAKWWTQGEKPDSSDVWEDLGIVDGKPTDPEGTANAPIDASIPKDTELTDFKVVGYYPSWKPDKLSLVDFDIVTHICYAFAIPKTDGTLRDLENPETAKTLIQSAHANKAKVLLSIGGWSYNDTPLENVFMEATSTDEKIEYFAKNIIAMCDKYGFDGIDMDWEHPRVDGTSAKQYENLMLILSEKLHAKDKLLTAAVLSGATADGNIYYDAAAHTNAVLNAVDFINIMAYDGGDGERHSPYQFAVDCGTYWKETRGLPAYKVVLGVPFYARPSWADYGTILESVPDAHSKDHSTYNGMDAYYNGMDTIAKKTGYAMENLGGVMIWELTQDTYNTEKSLLQTIGNTISSGSQK